MKIKLGIGEAEVDVSERDTEEDVAAKIAALAPVVAIAKEVGASAYFRAFETFDGMSDSTAREIAARWLESRDGEGGIGDLFIENDWCQDGDAYFREGGPKDELVSRLEAAVEAVTDAFEDLDADEIMEALVEALREDCVQAMYDNDASTPADAIPRHVTVELPFIPDYGDRGIEDLFTSHTDTVSGSETVIPDAALMRALKFFNVSPREFVEEAARRGIDLVSGEVGEGTSDYRRRQAEENALRWCAVLDVEAGSTGNISRLPLRSQGEIADWNETVELARTAKDHDRPASLSMDSLFTVLDNATYGGVPCYVMRVPLKDLVAGKFDTPFLATGGFVGLHDFINGSGYIEAPDGPVLIDPSNGGFRVRESKDEVDDVYGIVHRYYEARVAPVEVSPWQRIREDMWLRREGDGREAVVTRASAGDGTEEFWIATADGEGEAAGPRAVAEAYLSLEEAKAEGDRALAEEWAASPAP